MSKVDGEINQYVVKVHSPEEFYEKEINQFLPKNSKYRNKVYAYDLAVMIGYYVVKILRAPNIVNEDNLSAEERRSRFATFVNKSCELSDKHFDLVESVKSFTTDISASKLKKDFRNIINLMLEITDLGKNTKDKVAKNIIQMMPRVKSFVEKNLD